MNVEERFAQARPRLLRLAYSELGDVGEAEDVVQHKRSALGRRELLEHGQQRVADRLVERHAVGRVLVF